MTAIKTMSIERDDLASQNLIEIDEAEAEKESLSAQEEFRRLGRDIDAWRKSQGLPEEDELTEEEVVAICKEARAELYAEEQKQKMSGGR